MSSQSVDPNSGSELPSLPSLNWPLRLFALLLVAIGAILVAGGGWLLALGGSAYYVLAGVAVIASAILSWRGSRDGARVYGVMLLATLAWAIGEVGFDGWALTARLLAPSLLGLVFLLPALKLERRRATWPHLAFVAALLIGSVAVGAVWHAICTPEPADPIFRMGTIAAPEPSVGGPLNAAGSDWPVYGGQLDGTKFSTLSQITPSNVRNLKLAWTFDAGAPPPGLQTKLETTPVKIGDMLYFCTISNDIIAVEPETGKQKWRYHTAASQKNAPYGACRGVAYYRVPGATGACAERIITNTVDARLVAVDAREGTPCSGFGTDGQTSLLVGMGNADPGYYFVSSAPTIVRGKIVLGGWVTDGQYWGEPSGVIRAYDAVTGQLAWAFDMGHPDRHGAPPAGESYTPSTPNSWGPMSGDETLGLVFVPTGNSSPDFYGAQRRPFDDQYNSSVVALDADTGTVKWSFQTTHHDLWDYDIAAQPTLVDLPTKEGHSRRVLIQATKRGELFMLDAATGRPVTAVEERPVPQDGLAPGERLSATQPFSVGMPSLSGPELTERAMWGLTPLDQLWCRIHFRKAQYQGTLTPPGLKQTIIWPGYSGGSNWGGVSVDPDRHILIANAMRLATFVRLMPRAEADRQGIGPIGQASHGGVLGVQAQMKTPYAAEVGMFVSPLNVPCTVPPFGTISAIDLVSHKLIWTRPLGTAERTGPWGISSHLPLTMGVPNIGGSLVTRGGVTFIGAAMDNHFRAIDTATGKLLWQTTLLNSAQANPMTYRSDKDGRQYVVIMSGGAIGGPPIKGYRLMAYALPE